MFAGSLLIDLPEAILGVLLESIAKQPAANLATLNSLRRSAKKLKRAVDDDQVMKFVAQTRFDLEEKIAPDPENYPYTRQVDSFVYAVREWENFVHKYKLGPFRSNGRIKHLAPQYISAAKTWQKIETWLALNLPSLSLSDGVSEVHLEPHYTQLMREHALGYWLFYIIHDGQTYSEGEPTIEFPGLLGCYNAYDGIVDMHLVSSRYRLNPQPSPDADVYIVSLNLIEPKNFVLDLRDGMMYARWATTNLCHAVPTCSSDTNALLAWMGEYASRLTCGMYRVRDYLSLPEPRVSLFPWKGRTHSECVTRGIRVTASCIASPSFMGRQDVSVYSIGIRMAKPHEPGGMLVQDRGFDCAKLLNRHWRITLESGEVTHVRGPGVVGQHPTITDTGFFEDSNGYTLINHQDVEVPGVFVYESMSTDGLLMEGELEFKPIMHGVPGENFLVRVAPFELVRSEAYVYG